MNDDQITAISREYAEWVTDIPKAKELPNCHLNEANDLIADDAERMLTWLSRRFCLVEKEKAAKLCRLTLEHEDSVDYGLIDGLTDIVCDIFSEQYHQVAEGLDNPEIAKEVEV